MLRHSYPYDELSLSSGHTRWLLRLMFSYFMAAHSSGLHHLHHTSYGLHGAVHGWQAGRCLSYPEAHLVYMYLSPYLQNGLAARYASTLDQCPGWPSMSSLSVMASTRRLHHTLQRGLYIQYAGSKGVRGSINIGCFGFYRPTGPPSSL